VPEILLNLEEVTPSLTSKIRQWHDYNRWRYICMLVWSAYNERIMGESCSSTHMFLFLKQPRFC